VTKCNQTKQKLPLQFSHLTSYETLPKEWTSHFRRTTTSSPSPQCINRPSDHPLRQRNDRSHLGHSHGSGSSARESLNSQDLVVEVLVGEAVLGPGTEMSCCVYSAGSALVLPDGPVLGEGAGSGDGGLVGASVGALHVVGAVDVDRAELGHAGGAGVEAAVGL
jgi:hypothetical protein